MTTPVRVGWVKTADRFSGALFAETLIRMGIRRQDGSLLALFVIAFVGSWFARINVTPGAPLWLDECWTGAVAGQPSWRETIDQIWLDANAPLYPLMMHAWIGLFGDSNSALRLPSLLFGLATPILIAGWKTPGLRTRDRLALAAVIAVDPQAWLQSNEARGYTLLAFLSAGQTFAFIALMQRSSMRRAIFWVIWTSLVGLTHYQALMLGAVQGLIYLAVRREAALRTWPAALIFLPLGLEILWHAPRLALFARPDVAWYTMVTLWTAWNALIFLAGSGFNFIIPSLGFLAMAISTVVRTSWPRARPASSPVLWACASAVIAAALLLCLGALRPTFTLRYVTPFIPGVSLLLVTGARSLTRVFSGAVLAFVLAAMGASLAWFNDPRSHMHRAFTFEAASRDLMAVRPTRLIFIWDHPAQRVEAVRQYDALGGFLFRRAGSTVPVTSVMVRNNEDPNLLLVAAAREPRAVILWLYDLGVHGTAAIRHPPRLTTIDPSLGCRNYGRGSVGIVACSRAWRLTSEK